MTLRSTATSHIPLGWASPIYLNWEGTSLLRLDGLSTPRAAAQGKVQPAGRVKIVQSAIAGKTVSRPVENGTAVKAGDILVRLDDVEGSAQRAALAAASHALKAEIIRRRSELQALRGWSPEGVWAVPPHAAPPLSFPPDIPEPIRQREQSLYRAELIELASGLQGLAAERSRRRTEADGLKRALEAKRHLIDTLSERVKMRSALAASDAGSRASVLEALELQQKEEADLAAMEGQLAEAEASVPVVEAEARKLVDAFTADHLQKLSEAERRIDELTHEIVAADGRRRLMTIRSPIDGVVQASAVTTTGQVVQAGAELMRVIPDGAALEIEAYLPNRDVGFVAAGQPAVVKLEAFPFTRYGTLEGKVKRVGADAIPEPDAQQLEQSAARELTSLIPTGNVQRMQNLVFPVTIELLDDRLDINGKAVLLQPGMAATVEIKTGERRILDYLLSPVAGVADEAMHER